MASPKPKTINAAFGWSELSLIIPFLLGILAYNGLAPVVRDWLVVEPAIARAGALAARGAELAALPILLDQAADDARNPKLLWALGEGRESRNRANEWIPFRLRPAFAEAELRLRAGRQGYGGRRWLHSPAVALA